MTYSYTQISHYLGCPRRYRHRYLDGWREKETRASMLFGRVFEKALAAYFRREDSVAVLFEEWEAYRESPWNTPMAIAGNGWSARGCSCWNGSLRMTASEFVSLAATCRPN